jgi:outer membrane biosynthesis protein TonB
MKFIKLESRGGNYLVVAENVAWLRTAENGQTNVGIVGGQPLLVVGSIEEVAAKILAGSAPDEVPAPAAAAQPAPAAVSAAVPAPEPVVAAAPPPAPPAPEPEPEHVPAPEPESLAAPEPEPEPAPPKPVERPRAAAAPERPRAAAPKRPMSLSERIAAAAATTPKVKVASQRFMGALD